MILSIKRVVSTFLILGHNESRENARVAVFLRQDTMPTFPSHWAACSGSVEEKETPWQTAQREVEEELYCKNENITVHPQYGLYVDVPFKRTPEKETIIRVYPFTAHLGDNCNKLELRGTEHVRYQWVSVSELEQLRPTVPSLARAFHHATRGRFLQDVPDCVNDWAENFVDGAATMARQAVQIVQEHPKDVNPSLVKMLRPSMVPITNAMTALEQGRSPETVLEALARDTDQTIDHAVQELGSFLQGRDATNIATVSRSSTLVAVLRRLLSEFPGDKIHLVCGKSTPGDEGVLMAQDLGKVPCIDDEELEQRILDGTIDVLLTGSDCITDRAVVNKVGTARLARAARASNTAVFCCTDRWKQWDDIFPPPLEDIFEEVPLDLFDKILMPEAGNKSNQVKV